MTAPRHLFRLALLSLPLAIAASPVHAQAEPQDAEAEQQARREIIVTGRASGYQALDAVGTRDGAALLDTPQSMQVLTEDLLRDQRADTFSALANVPSVRNSAPANFDGLRVQVRGFFAPTALDGMLSKVGNGPAANLGPDLTGIERIEVLLGPASLLFGNSSPGGTINFITKQSEAEPGYFVTATLGSYDFFRAEADLTGPLDQSGKISYRLSTSVRDQGSFLEGASTRNSVIMPSVRAMLGDRTSLTVEGAYKLLDLDRQNFGLPAVGTILANPNGRISRRRNVNTGSVEVEQHRIGARLVHEFSDDWSVSSILRFVDTDYAAVGAELPGALAADGRTLSRTPFDSFDAYGETQMQTTLRGRFATGAVRHELIAGLDLSRSTADFRYREFDPSGPIDIFSPVYSVRRGALNYTYDAGNTLRELGLFLQDRIVFSDQWSLVLGGRYDSFEQVDTDLAANTRARQTGSAFSPRVGLIFKPHEAVSLYASYSKSFQPQIGRTVTGEAFAPTRGEQLELGAKVNLTEGLTGSLAVYRIDQTNVATPDPVNVGFSVLDGEQRSQGVELSLAGTILPGWSIQASYAYLDAEITRTNTAAFQGRQVQRTSPHSANIWSSYEVQSGPLKGLGFGGGVTLVDKRPVNNANTLTLPGYTLLDAVISYEIDGWRFALNARNLTDSFAFDAFGLGRVTYGTPRTFEGTVSWSF
ncbi:MAG: TonB-dependent siderophore receptor [Pseudomonadota bacterium]